MSMTHRSRCGRRFSTTAFREFVFSLPEELKIRRSRLKFELRELMATKAAALNRRELKEGWI
jgi:hypothetical protein